MEGPNIPLQHFSMGVIMMLYYMYATAADLGIWVSPCHTDAPLLLSSKVASSQRLDMATLRNHYHSLALHQVLNVMLLGLSNLTYWFMDLPT